MGTQYTHAKTLIEYLDMRSQRLENGCVVWTKHKDNDGYGRHVGKYYKEHGKSGIHQLSYIAHKGPIPNGMCVCHSCDNPSCFNPDHLWLGTVAENNKDKQKKKRYSSTHQATSVPRGDANPLSKLTEESVREIKREFKGHYGEIRKIARAYNVNSGTVWSVLKGRSWRHVQ